MMSDETLTEPEEGATSDLFGYSIRFDGKVWRFEDTGEATEEGWRNRPCGHCGLDRTPEDHDGCLGTLAGIDNACCGHGVTGEAYLVFPSGARLEGEEARRVQAALIALRGEEGWA